MRFKLKPIQALLMLIFLMHCGHTRAQNFGDPQFYLIDSLDIDALADFDRTLLDSCLVEYHKATEDTARLSNILYVVDRCWDPEVWPKYNQLMIDKSIHLLSFEQDQAIRDKLIYFVAGGISNVGFLHDEKGELMTALDYYHQGLQLYEQIDNKEGKSTTYNNLGVIYSIIGDEEKGLLYHHKSLELKKEIGDLEGIGMSYNNIGTIYEKSDPFKALEYYEASLNIRQEINDIRGIAMSYDNIGDIYYSQEIYSKAHQYYMKGHQLWIETEIMVGLTTSLNNLAGVNLKLGNHKIAEEYGIESFEIAISLGFPADIENASRTLMDIYRSKGDYESAMKYADEYMKMREKIRSDQSAQNILKKSMQYEYQSMALKDSLEHAKETEVQELKLKEKETQNYALFGGIALLFVVLLLGIRSYKQKQKDNKKINEQKQEVESQKAEIEKQHLALAATHKEISDSISYAKRIQEAILPTQGTLNKLLKNGFVFYEPKDIVSGDFYWIVENKGNLIFAVADCTGHGVPGAMVSVVCHNALNRAVREFDLSNPADILNKTRDIVIDTFTARHGNVRDGMDISICNWNREKNELQWAGANNPLYILRAEKAEESDNERIEIISPNKQPVGKFETAAPFTSHTIELNKGDRFYLFTDGFMDQFGGPDGKKYKYSRFRDFLVSNQTKEMKKQGEALSLEFSDWKGNLEQIDDVCIIGVKV